MSVSVSNRSMSSAMVPPARTYKAMTYSGVKPTRVPMVVAAVRRAAVISEILMVDHLFPLYYAVKWVWEYAIFCCGCATRSLMDASAHVLG